LKQGESIPFHTLDITALDSTGTAIRPFGPALRIDDHRIAALEAGRIIGVSAGTTYLILGAPVTDPQTGRGTMRDLTRIVILVWTDQAPS
jgi:hypothetical protein